MNELIQIIHTYDFESDKIINPDTGKNIDKKGNTFKQLLSKYVTKNNLIQLILNDEYEEYQMKLDDINIDLDHNYSVKLKYYYILDVYRYFINQAIDILGININKKEIAKFI